MNVATLQPVRNSQEIHSVGFMRTPNTSRRASQLLTTFHGSRQTSEDNIQVQCVSRGFAKQKSGQHTQSCSQPGPLDTQTLQLHLRTPFRQVLDVDKAAESHSACCKSEPQRGEGTGLTVEHSSHSTARQGRQAHQNDQAARVTEPASVPLSVRLACCSSPLSIWIHNRLAKPNPYMLSMGPVPLPKVPSNFTLNSQRSPPCTKLSKSYNESTL